MTSWLQLHKPLIWIEFVEIGQIGDYVIVLKKSYFNLSNFSFKQYLWNIWKKNLTTLYVKLLLSPSLWLTHAPHVPRPLQRALRAFRSPQQLLSSADTQPASTTGHRQEWLSVSTAANPAGRCGFPAGIATISTSPKTYGNVCMGMCRVCVWKGWGGGGDPVSPYVILPFFF